MTTIAPAPVPAARARLLIVLARVIAVAWVALGVGCMLLLSPRVPYADPWRFLARYLTTPFPDNVLAADNGHLEVLPNLLRLAELELCAADQSLQIGVGIALALATWWLFVAWFRHEPPPVRAAATLLIALGWFWLGNGRKLAHGNESVALFLVVGSVLVGSMVLARAGQLQQRHLLWSGACGLVATLSFGAGFASFGAFAMVLWLGRARLHSFAGPVLAAGLAVALLFAGGDRIGAEVAAFERLDLLVRWLGAPLVWLASPFLDPEHAARMPWGWLRLLAEPVAGSMHAAFGAPLTARWPAAAAGGFVLAALVVGSVQHRRRGRGSGERVALGLAWFGVGVGLLVVVSRLDYFRQYPTQVTTQRYLPWSMLVWTGLLLTATLRCRDPRRVFWPALLALLAFTPSQVWTARYAWKQRAVAERTALGAAVGVLERGFPLEETDENDLALAMPLLRAAGVAMFAWPETRMLGESAGDRVVPVAVDDLDVQPVDNRFAAPGVAVQFHASTAPRGRDRLVLLDGDDRVCGLAMRLPFDPLWRGYARGAARTTVRVAALR